MTLRNAPLAAVAALTLALSGAALAQDTTAVPSPPPPPGEWRTIAPENLLVIDTKAKHSLDDGQYGARRSACERAAQVLGVDAARLARTGR